MLILYLFESQFSDSYWRN